MTIDTLQIYEQLRSSSLPDEAAKGIANVIKNVTETDLANKRDVALIQKDIEQVRSELTQKIEQVRAELTQKIELGNMELRRDMESMRAGLLKWMAAMLVTQAVVIAAIVKLI